MNFSRLVLSGWLIALAFGLLGCASQESVTVATLRGVMRGSLLPQTDGSPPQLDSRFRYLRVQYNQLPAVYMALGFVDVQANHSIQTWYSADGEVIQLHDGRIVGTVGIPHDWTNVKFSALPSWNELASGKPLTYTRQRDSKVGYAYNTTDTVQAVRHGATTQFPSTAPQLPETAWWVEETTPALPTAYVAVLPTIDGPTWVYSYQCLTPQVCLSMQPWPPAFTGP